MCDATLKIYFFFPLFFSGKHAIPKIVAVKSVYKYVCVTT